MSDAAKSYVADARRQEAALNACRGLPTAWLERDLVNELYKAMALLALADKMGDRPSEAVIQFPIGWWNAHVRGALDSLNLIADPTQRQ